MKRDWFLLSALRTTRCSHIWIMGNNMLPMEGRWLKQSTDSFMSGLRCLSSHGVCQSSVAPVADTLASMMTANMWTASHCLSNEDKTVKSKSQNDVDCSVVLVDLTSVGTAYVSAGLVAVRTCAEP